MITTATGSAIVTANPPALPGAFRPADSQLAHVSPETFAAMEAAARARGLGPYMDSGFRLRNMSQTGCPP